MRRIAVVTGARSDYGIYTPLLRRLASAPDVVLLLIAGGSHMDPRYGRTVDVIRADGFEVAAEIDMAASADEGAAMAEAMGRGLSGFADAYNRLSADIVVSLGDRFEMLSAACAAVPLRLPLAHIHGGELTEGALDDAIRHAITKLSHLHFVSTEDYARRVIGLGEEPWRVTVSGAPALDNLRDLTLMTRDEIDRAYGLAPGEPFVLATFHPVTQELDATGEHVDAFLDALDRTGLQVVLTFPNADMGSAVIIDRLRAFAAGRARVHLVANLGTPAYFGMMAQAAAMAGNSSSGIIEAASFRLPVVNIGNRQHGRVRGANVIDCEPDRASISAALSRALDPAFRAALRSLRNPYGDGRAADRIVEVLRTIPIDDRLLRKRFYEPEAVPAAAVGRA